MSRDASWVTEKAPEMTAWEAMIVAMVARTTSGEVVGREHHGVLQFAGVPYAAAPVRALDDPNAAERRFWDGLPATSAVG